MQLEIGQVGPRTMGPGSHDQIRLGSNIELIGADGAPKYYEMARLGQIYHAQNATNRAPGTALGTTAPLAIWNPPSSGKNLVLLGSMFKWASGTLGAGALWYVGHAAQNVEPTGTAITPVSGLVGGAGAAALAYENVSVLTTQKGIRQWANIAAVTADPATVGLFVIDTVDGDIVVAPGNALSLQAVAGAGSTPLVVEWLKWAELPIPS